MEYAQQVQNKWPVAKALRYAGGATGAQRREPEGVREGSGGEAACQHHYGLSTQGLLLEYMIHKVRIFKFQISLNFL